MSLAPVLVTAPAELPITVEDLKAHLRVDSADEDVLIEIYAGAATAQLDGYHGILGRALVTQTWRQDFDSFDDLRLPLGPVSSVTHVKYYDGDNALQTLSSSVYRLLTDESGGYLELVSGEAWPSIYTRDDAVQVTFVAGVAVDQIPSDIRAAIMLMAADLYANRETVGEGLSMVPMSMTVDRLIARHRRISV